MVTSLDKLRDSLKKHYDVFIASASFEERSFSVVKNIIPDISFSFKFVVAVLHNRPFIEDSLTKFKSDFEFEQIDVDSMNQLLTVKNYLSNIEIVLKNNPEASFLIDISTFTRQNLLILLRVLRNRLSKKNKIELLYSLVSDYAVGLPENEKWLSKGILSVSSVFGYSGIISPSKPYHLIILMGYEEERAASLIYAYEPAKITIGIASDEGSLSSTYYQVNKERLERLVMEFPTAEQFEFNCSDIGKSEESILIQSKKYPTHNIVISPMNNKLSTISLALASFKNHNIQVAIATPAIYNYAAYSSPGTDCIFFDATDMLLKD